VNKNSPLLLLLLGILVGFPAARLTTGRGESDKPAAKADQPAKPEPSPTEDSVSREREALQEEVCKQPAGDPQAKYAGSGPPDAVYPWCMPVRLLRQFFSLPPGVEKTRGESLHEVMKRADATNYDLRFMVALVPGAGAAQERFEPKHLVSLGGWVALAAAVALTLWIFLQMDRNATLSRIGGTTPGQVTFDRAFLSKLVTYVGVPALGLVATLLPAVGQMFGRVTSQLLRVVGGG
jgi:hypothetical protein